MKEGFTIWIPDDAEIQAINIAIMVKNEKTNGLTMFNLTEDQIKDCTEWYFSVDSNALPVRNGEC